MTKTIRIAVSDAFIIEQAVRDLAAELQQELKVSDLMNELVKGTDEAKKRLAKKINEEKANKASK